jgi:hypothetical protein
MKLIQKKSLKLSLCAFLLALSSQQALAQFTITVESYGDVPVPLRASLDSIYDLLETEIQGKLPNIDLSNFLKGVADGTAAAGSGVDADYASPMQFALLGVNLGAAVKFKDNFGIGDLFGGSGVSAIQGGGAQAGLLIGGSGKMFPQFKIGPIDSHRAKGYMSLFFFGKDLNLFGGTVDVDIAHFAVSGQYKIIEEKSMGRGIFKWGGVDLTGGLRYNVTTLSYTKTVPTIALTPSTFGTGTVTPGFTNGAINLAFDTSTFSVPMEASTSVRLLYFLTFYTGAGMDFHFGKTSGNATATGNINTEFSGISGITNQPVATAAWNLNQTPASPNVFDLRGFFGTQIEMGVFALYAQAQKALVGGPIGATVGVKAFW